MWCCSMIANTKTVSVLIPTYNCADYLVEAIESVKAQTYQSWEVIVVDDGSTDNTRDRVKRFMPDVTYVRQVNQGVSAARNRALRECTGKYIMFLDSDDLLLPKALEKLSTILDQNPCVDVVYSDGYIIDGEGKPFSELSVYRPAVVEHTLESFVLTCPVDIHSSMIRRRALSVLEGPFDEQMIGYEDRDLFIRLRASGCSFLYVPEFTCCYRFHGGNKSAPKSSYSEERHQSLIHSRMKILNAPWFDTLSTSAQYRFFLHFVTSVLVNDYSKQDEVLTHPLAERLPPEQRSNLLYYLTIENLLGDVPWTLVSQRLTEAIKLCPKDPRPYLLLILSCTGFYLRKRLIRAWRRAKLAPEKSDPVIEHLRSKDVA